MITPVAEILDHCRPLLSRYPALICDVWGVLHDGVTAYPESSDSLARYRAQGGRVVLLSNSPQPSDEIKINLQQRGVSDNTYDAIVTSGDLTREEILRRKIMRVYRIGPDRHEGLFKDQAFKVTLLDEAQAVVCTGFDEVMHHQQPSEYNAVLQQALQRGLPFLCANPDLIVDIGGTLYPCAGMIAAHYEKMGGHVHWAGKPHGSAYEAALRVVSKLLGRAVQITDVLAIGDALRTDIAGAQGARLDALFIAQGIHREDTAQGGRIDAEKLQALFKKETLSARAAAFSLTW